MRRAFVGFSSPIGYNYVRSAPKTANDGASSPDPVLYGATGLMTLYDEIWFACRSLCPSSMRGLRYVKFLDEEYSLVDLSGEGVDEQIQEFDKFLGPFGIGDLFAEGYNEGMRRYVGGANNGIDNHTHGLMFMGVGVNGNVAGRPLLFDLYLHSRFAELDFDIVLNPLGAKVIFNDQAFENFRSAVTALGRLEIAERIISLTSMYDLVGPGGPYHPVLEELRNDDLLRDFRAWMDGYRNRLDNQELEEVARDVDVRVRDITRNSIRKFVARDAMTNVAIDLIKDGMFELVPGAGPIHRLLEKVHRNAAVKPLAAGAFVALARDSLSDVRQHRPTPP